MAGCKMRESDYQGGSATVKIQWNVSQVSYEQCGTFVTMLQGSDIYKSHYVRG